MPRIDPAAMWAELVSKINRIRGGATPEQQYQINKNKQDISVLYAVTDSIENVIPSGTSQSNKLVNASQLPPGSDAPYIEYVTETIDKDNWSVTVGEDPYYYQIIPFATSVIRDTGIRPLIICLSNETEYATIYEIITEYHSDHDYITAEFRTKTEPTSDITVGIYYWS